MAQTAEQLGGYPERSKGFLVTNADGKTPRRAVQVTDKTRDILTRRRIGVIKGELNELSSPQEPERQKRHVSSENTIDARLGEVERRMQRSGVLGVLRAAEGNFRRNGDDSATTEVYFFTSVSKNEEKGRNKKPDRGYAVLRWGAVSLPHDPTKFHEEQVADIDLIKSFGVRVGVNMDIPGRVKPVIEVLVPSVRTSITKQIKEPGGWRNITDFPTYEEWKRTNPLPPRFRDRVLKRLDPGRFAIQQEIRHAIAFSSSDVTTRFFDFRQVVEGRYTGLSDSPTGGKGKKIT